MTGLLRVVLAVAVFVATLSSNAALSIYPIAPTSADPVTLRVSFACSLGLESVTRTGSNIRVVLDPGSCPSPPLLYAYEFSLGILPPGKYDLEVTTYSDVPPESLSFIVRNDDPAVTVRPFVVPTNTPRFLLRFKMADDFLFCGNPDCSDWVMDIGGVQYRKSDWVSIDEPGLAFYAPDLAPGLHDITITNSRGSTHVPAALYYHAPGGPADPAIFERVLFPVLFSGSGLNGSDWRSEVVISNPTPLAIENANTIEPPKQCFQYPCGERVEPLERRAFSGLQYAHGVALMVPRPEVEDLDFSLRVRDASREADGFGTEVPVVRESEMVRDAKLALLDVPLDPRYRVKLRIYQFRDPAFEEDWNSNDIGVRVVLADGTPYPQPAAARAIPRRCDGAACQWTPYYLEADLPARAEGGRADVYVEFTDGALGWAFVSVTNNQTQQITVITPQG